MSESCAHENTDGDGAWNDDDGTLDSLKPQGEAMARKAFKTMLQLGDEGEALGAATSSAVPLDDVTMALSSSPSHEMPTWALMVVASRSPKVVSCRFPRYSSPC